ncbi:MAG TPA: cyclase family protein [Candidatus Omnitrophica bacterium]|nr:cyclase family protein [Candidatus Omnitrophota bacterium]
MRIIDLSLPVKNNLKGELELSSIKYLSYKRGGSILGLGGCFFQESHFPARFKNLFLYILGIKKVSFKAFPENSGLRWEILKLSTHCGTHMDAPSHYGPSKDMFSIEKVPLELCFSNGVVLDFRNKKAGDFISSSEIKEKLLNINYKLNPKDIVLIMTGRDKLYNNREYPFSHPGLSKDAVEYLLDKGVRIIGIDAWSLDRPINFMVKDYLRTKDKSYLWPAHMVGRRREYFQIEKLANLDRITKPCGFKVLCFPIKIENASAGWCRVVAIE